MSRHPTAKPDPQEGPDDVMAVDTRLREDATCSLQNLQSISWDVVKAATATDTVMNILLENIEMGIPETREETPLLIRDFHQYRDHLYILDRVVMYKDRIVIPQQLRPSVLETLHSAHQGTTKMIARATTSVFWPGITRDIEEMRNRCTHCNRMAPSQPAAPPTALAYPEYPFQKVCADFFTYKGKHYLVLVDRYSNWPIVERSHNGANRLIKFYGLVPNSRYRHSHFYIFLI